jgi:O-antigen ligase
MPLIPSLLIGLLLVATLLAGGPSPLGEMLARLLAIALLAALVWQRRDALASLPAWVWALIAALVALPLFQLIPGGAMLAGGEARALLAADQSLAGVVSSAWAPLSLHPMATEDFLWSLLPPIAACLAVWTLHRAQVQVLVWCLLGLALFQVLLGGIQAYADPDGAAYVLQGLYPQHNHGRAIGSFANVNHTGGFILMLLPLAWAMLLAAWQRKQFDGDARPGDALALPMLSVIIVLLLVGLLLTRSRAVIGLSMLLLALALLVIAPRAESRGAGRFLAVVMAVGVLAAVELGLWAALSRFERDPMADLRWTMLTVGWQAIGAWWPWGSGMGSFVDAFAPFLPLEHAGSSYINHAHNDYVELLLEAGLPGALVMIAFQAGFGWALVRVLRHSRDSATSRLLALGAGLGMLTILLHSLVDYPLRTGGVSVAFGILAGMLLRGAWQQRQR